MKTIFNGIIFLAFSILISHSANAATITSKTNVTANWDDPNAWVGGIVPTAGDDVQIASGAIITIQSTTIVYCKSLNLLSSDPVATLKIAGTNTLNVSGKVTVNSGAKSIANTLAVGDGTLLVGGDLEIRGNNGLAELTIRKGTVNVVGDLILQNAGQKQLITGDPAYPYQSTFTVGGSVGDKGTITNVYINQHYFRTKKSGNWDATDVWEYSADNNKWVSVKTAPPQYARIVTVVSPHIVTFTPSGSYIYDKEVIVNGILDCGVYKMTGAGSFSLNTGATIRTKDQNGITKSGATGSIQVTGARTYSPDANYTYDGTVAQNTGNGLPAILNGVLTINSSVIMPAGVTLSQKTRVTNLVNVTKGRLISNGNLTLEGKANSNANVQGPTGSGKLDPSNYYLTGDVNVESWFTGGDITKRGTRTISSPISDAGTASIFKQLQKSMFITGNGADFDPGPESILTYNEPAMISQGVAAQYGTLPSGINTKSTPGQGYFLYYRGDRTPENMGANPPQNLTTTYTGPINQGNITINLSFTNNTGPRDDEYNGFNLVGNPYPAVIDWTKVTRSDINNIDNMVSIIKPGGGMTTYSNGIVTNDAAALPAGALPPGNGSAISYYIQPGQGFYVRTRAIGTSLTFTEASKAVDKVLQPQVVRLLDLPQTPFLAFAGPMMGVPSLQAEPAPPQVLRINLQDSKNIDETAIVFKQGYGAEYGGGDAIYFSGSTVSLCSLTSDEKSVAINFMPDIKEVAELKLWVNAANSGTVKLNFTDFKGAGEYQVFLKDAYLDKVINVKVSPVYEFNIDKANANTFGSARFKLLFQAPVCTDAQSISLKANKVSNGAELGFVAKGEKNSNPFEVERSVDGKSFEKIAQVQSKAQADLEYVFLDKKPHKGISYYRIKQKGNSETWIYSNVFSLDLITINTDKTDLALNVYPNPAVNEIRINYQSPDRDLIMSVYNLSGKKMKEVFFKRKTELKGNISELSQGMYLIELSDASNKQIMGWAKFYKN